MTDVATSILSLLGGSKLTLAITCACLLAPPLLYVYRYRSSIKKRLKEIEKNAGISKVVRNKHADTTNKRVVCLELDPAFVQANPDWRLMSFGEYLGQLEPAEKGSAFSQLFYQKELEMLLGKLLLDKLGTTYGAALLPMLGAASVSGSIASISSKISGFIAKSVMTDGKEAKDPLMLDLSLMEITSGVNLYQKGSGPDNGPGYVSPIQYLGRGEIGRGDLAYDLGDGKFPMVFDVDKDFANYIKIMEARIFIKDGEYDPLDRSFPPPTPVSERLLPGLHLGMGGIKCTHTKREGIEHRLLCLLMNKLAHNYYKLSCQHQVEDCFTVLCAGKKCLFPEEFMQALVDCGHKVEVCPRVLTANFGIQLCVKEEDDSFTTIPFALFLLTGVERPSDGKPAYFGSPHGGMDVRVSGPIIGKGSRPAWLQFYVALSGLCCFHPDEDQDAPWTAKTTLSEPYDHEDMLRAIRMCSLVAVTFNRIATELNLPFGGYGILGMCNDSSTIIDWAIRRKTNAYPLLSTGRYLAHICSYFIKMKEELSSNSCAELKPFEKDIISLIKSAATLPSDLHISPSSLIDVARRYDKSYGVVVFQATTEAKEILGGMASTAKVYAG